MLPAATAGSPLPRGCGVLGSTKPGRAPRCAWTLERASRAHVPPRGAGCWLPSCAELPPAACTRAWLAAARHGTGAAHRGPPPPSSPTQRDKPWVAWLVGSTGESVPAFLLRENASSPMNVQQQKYIKACLMATSKQEGRERQTRRLATVGGEKQLALRAGEGLLQPQGETWQMGQTSQMSQKGWGMPAPNVAAGRLSPTTRAGGGQGCRCESRCSDVLAHCAQQSGFRIPGGDRAKQDGSCARFCCSSGAHHGRALACLYPGASQEANSQGRGAPGSG